jgi:hypothetical protein
MRLKLRLSRTISLSRYLPDHRATPRVLSGLVDKLMVRPVQIQQVLYPQLLKRINPAPALTNGSTPLQIERAAWLGSALYATGISYHFDAVYAIKLPRPNERLDHTLRRAICAVPHS